jgi:predicted TIM-barrel fold metal-dependent hydrolase
MTAKALDWIIDTDTHVTEPPDLWTSRLPRKYHDRAPRVVLDPRMQLEVWKIGAGQSFLPVGHSAVAGWPEPFPAGPRSYAEVPAAARDAKARLAYMDELGIWACALYPNVGGFGNQDFLKIADDDLRLACVRAYNDWLCEWCSAERARFIPICATPYWDVRASVAEIERNAARGFQGILFTGEPDKNGFPILADPHWEPLWRCAEETGLPVSFHIGSADFTADFSAPRLRHMGLSASNARAGVCLFIENGKQIVDLLLAGVLPRHPRLRVVSVESGIGWLPFLLEAVDYAFEQSAVRAQRPEYEEKPSHYFRQQVYACYFFEELAPRHQIDQIGADNILFETDYPHPICLYGNVRAKVEAGLRGQDPALRRKLLFENAARLYRVPSPDRASAPRA